MWTNFWTRLRQIQSNIYLPGARILLLIGAFVACIVAVISLLAAGYFQSRSWKSAPEAHIPAPYISKNPNFDLDVVAAKVTGPTNIRFISNAGLIPSPLGKNEVIGRFEADTPNGLRAPPNDFALLGGKDVNFFSTVRGGGGGVPQANQPRLLGDPQSTFRYGLLASEDLNDLIRKTVAAGKVQSHQFTVRIIAFDKLGNKSSPQDVTFSLEFGPKPAQAAIETPAVAPTPEKHAEPSIPETPLTVLAHEIALVADPARGPAFFNVYAKAVEVPRLCGATDNAAFLADYRHAFEFAKKRLTIDNVITGFLPSVCDSWRIGVAAEHEAEAAANAQRVQAMVAAQAAQAQATLLSAASRVSRNLALSILLGAVGVLLLLSFPLALLLLENHSSALRAIVEKLDTNRTAVPIREEAAP